MKTGEAGAWTQHTHDPGVSEAVLALAKVQKQGGDNAPDTDGTSTRSMSDRWRVCLRGP